MKSPTSLPSLHANDAQLRPQSTTQEGSSSHTVTPIDAQLKSSYADKAATGQTYTVKTGRTVNFQSTGGNRTPNPYDDANFNLAGGAHISDDELRSALAHLPEPPAKPADGMRAVHFVGNVTAVKSRMVHLQQRDFDAHTMKTSQAPVWIDLPLVHPSMEIYANELLETVGKVVYVATTTSRSRFPHIRGCVLTDLNQDLVEYIVLDLPGIREFKIEVEYRSMPDACFVCRRRGHQARHCPTKKGTTPIPPPPIAVKAPELGAPIARPTTTQHLPGSTTRVQKDHTTSNPPKPHTGLLDGFTVVPTRLKGGTTQGGERLVEDPSPLVLNQNPFALLDDDEEGAGEDEITIPIASPLTQVILSKGIDNTQIPITAPIRHQSAPHSAPVAADSTEVTTIVTPIKQKVHSEEEANPRGDTLNATDSPNLAQHNSAKNIRKALVTLAGIFTSPTSVEGNSDPKSTAGPKREKLNGDDVLMTNVSSEALLRHGHDRFPTSDVQDDSLPRLEPDEMEGVGSNELMEDVGMSLSHLLASQSTSFVQECYAIPEVENTTFLNRTDHNVPRASKTHKVKARTDGDIQALCLQECRVKKDKIDFLLNQLVIDGNFVVDFGADGRAGPTILVLAGVQILDKGTKGDGTFAWITVSSPSGPISVGSIYAPNGQGGREIRTQLWKWLRTKLHSGNWILGGNYNMVEHPDNSVGPHALIHGTESRKWARLLDQQDLVDTYFCVAGRKGPKYTRQALRGERFDQARLAGSSILQQQS
ncbi:unnamed protein product [Calypogeia fissa]